MAEVKHLNDRLVDNDPELIRLDITASALIDFNSWEKEDFLAALQRNASVKHVHLSGDGLEDVLTPVQIEMLVESVGYMDGLEELFLFKGGNEDVTGARLAHTLQLARKLKVFMLWGFSNLETELELAAAIRNHLTLERVTLTVPTRSKYAAIDVLAMGLASMPKLKCLCVRCKYSQSDPIISPEALTLLMSSKSLESLYLENCGLVDDHSDAIAQELPNNRCLTLIDLKHNLFTDDCLYTFAQYLPHNQTLLSLDVSGATISEGGVYALAEAMKSNHTLTHLELEGEASRFVDEFDIPDGHKYTDYMQALHFRLRLNRTGKRENKEQFVEALNLVSDHVGCLFHLLRANPGYCDKTMAPTASCA